MVEVACSEICDTEPRPASPPSPGDSTMLWVANVSLTDEKVRAVWNPAEVPRTTLRTRSVPPLGTAATLTVSILPVRSSPAPFKGMMTSPIVGPVGGATNAAVTSRAPLPQKVFAPLFTTAVNPFGQLAHVLLLRAMYVAPF